MEKVKNQQYEKLLNNPEARKALDAFIESQFVESFDIEAEKSHCPYVLRDARSSLPGDPVIMWTGLDDQTVRIVRNGKVGAIIRWDNDYYYAVHYSRRSNMTEAEMMRWADLKK
jgi:hypothetical protein